jgi:putative mRNA 3-end processing factor
MDLIVQRPQGLYCPQGDFYIDPWRPVHRAVITHAHADHARGGHTYYLAASPAQQVLLSRLGRISLQTLAYGDSISINGVQISLHPAGHVLGSAQVRLEHQGQVWVASGDYKTEADGTCDAFEPVRCHTFITESTFGLPIYRWQTQDTVFDQINTWWRTNAAAGRASVVYCYSFGKAQRILSGLDTSIGLIISHGAVEAMNRAYRETGVSLPTTHMVSEIVDPSLLKTACVIAPPSTQGTSWLKRFGDYSDAFASGWMQLRGARRRRAVDRGFVMSDHADWPGLHRAIRATGAERIIVTHGYVATMVRCLEQQGFQASAFNTEYTGEGDDHSIDMEGAAQ